MDIKHENKAQPSSTTDTISLTSISPEFKVNTQMATSIGISLIGVIVLILLLGWIVKRFNWKSPNKQLIEVKATYNINPKERIVLVHVDHQLLVVGVTGQQMTLLHTINEQRTDMLLAEPSAEKDLSKNKLFEQMLQSILKLRKE
ncbi:flagellar biosynthetic protein FliO [Gilliamella sp. B2776]|uniref:flagellar biosynthetic protein FliO n=2 Tax=Gilliamella TaxID=1193503 RepID=UPI002269AE3A|nr:MULTISPECIES: flagellar biosynthetic protein FliO [unclassified Gilliamella]MCX8650867.1 flagellar biosynthetic protein FliO [Gilliamella sp. B2779]MCX8654150.1 flagellar biosynthetic protein FliO [Gilliamella sp. B2737]MCX8657200.1 flagellar biosynthetic protein FliO [Gilliamella sp. B2894]MCX8665877.1 flagellar biosynthetic protein FliO [Gilliamella sp. B2887]MCX8692717.1 flagellar biosynthetic protein FliO [Gilliamella sp. B2776]